MITNEEFQETVKQLAAENQKNRLLSILKGTIYYSIAIEQAAKHKHSDLVNSLLMTLGINLDKAITKSAAELAMLNKALYGYAAGLHFDEVKMLQANGANIAYGLNALIDNNTLNQDNALTLIECCQPDSLQQKMFIKDITRIFDVELTHLEPTHTAGI